MREQAQAESARITANAQAQMEAEKQQVLNQLKSEVGTLATGLAGRIVGESLEDEARQRRTVERFIAEIESQSAGQSVMRGISAEGYADSVERLEAVAADGDAGQLGNELFAVAAVLGQEPALRRALTDPSAASEAKSSLARGVFGDKLGAGAVDVAATAAAARWSSTADFVDAIEQLGALALRHRLREGQTTSATSRTSCSASDASCPATRSCATRSPTAWSRSSTGRTWYGACWATRSRRSAASLVGPGGRFSAPVVRAGARGVPEAGLRAAAAAGRRRSYGDRPRARPTRPPRGRTLLPVRPGGPAQRARRPRCSGRHSRRAR